MPKKIPTSIRLNNLTPEFDEAIRLKRIELLQQGKDYKKEDIVKEIVLEYKNNLKPIPTHGPKARGSVI